MNDLFIPTTQADIDNLGCDEDHAIPNFLSGDDIAGWSWLKTLLVNSSGMGADNERALTIPQFKQAMEIGKGYAVVDQGQFQVQVGVFERIDEIDAVESPQRRRSNRLDLSPTELPSPYRRSCDAAPIPNPWSVHNGLTIPNRV